MDADKYLAKIDVTNRKRHLEPLAHLNDAPESEHLLTTSLIQDKNHLTVYFARNYKKTRSILSSC